MGNVVPTTDTYIRLPHWGLQAFWKLAKTASHRAETTPMEEKRFIRLMHRWTYAD
jgi:hypothetical protein